MGCPKTIPGWGAIGGWAGTLVTQQQPGPMLEICGKSSKKMCFFVQTPKRLNFYWTVMFFVEPVCWNVAGKSPILLRWFPAKFTSVYFGDFNQQPNVFGWPGALGAAEVGLGCHWMGGAQNEVACWFQARKKGVSWDHSPIRVEPGFIIVQKKTF